MHSRTHSTTSSTEPSARRPKCCAVPAAAARLRGPVGNQHLKQGIQSDAKVPCCYDSARKVTLQISGIVFIDGGAATCKEQHRTALLNHFQEGCTRYTKAVPFP